MSADSERPEKSIGVGTPSFVSPLRRRSNEAAFSPYAIKAHEGQVRQLQSKVADFAAGVESAAGDLCGPNIRKKQAAFTRRFAKTVDKELAGMSDAVAQSEAECISARVRHAAADQAVEEVFHAAKSLDLFLKDVQNL
jgi:hypothetical protein